MQGQAAALKGRGEDLSTAIGSLEPFASQATGRSGCSTPTSRRSAGSSRNGGEVFDALSERQGQLSGLIRASNRSSQTTANRNAELEEIFQIFPTFLRESRADADAASRSSRSTPIRWSRSCARRLAS